MAIVSQGPVKTGESETGQSLSLIHREAPQVWGPCWEITFLWSSPLELHLLDHMSLAPFPLDTFQGLEVLEQHGENWMGESCPKPVFLK